MVSSSQAAEECLRILDGRVKYFFIDVEAKKKNLNLEYIAENNVKKVRLLYHISQMMQL
ncbi:hypothetical protein GCM10020331_052810 [Ectobacillus funiculus]